MTRLRAKRCKLETTDRPGVLYCPVCKRPCESEHPPERTHRTCCRKLRGLGDAIARVTSAVGLKPCGGCRRRQQRLNRLWPWE